MQNLILIPLLVLSVLTFISFLLIIGSDTLIFFIGIITNVFLQPRDFFQISPVSSVKEKLTIHFLPLFFLLALGFITLKLLAMLTT